MLAKLNLSDHERSGAALDAIGALGDSPLLELGPAAAVFPVSKSIVTHSSSERSLVSPPKRVDSPIPKFMLLARLNHESDGASDFGTALRVAFNLYEAGVSRVLSPPVRRFRKAIKSVPKDDDRLMPAFVGGATSGFRKLAFLEEGFTGKAAPFSYASTPRAARLKEREFRDRVPRALFRSSSRDVRAPGIGIELVGWSEAYKVLSTKLRHWYINLMATFIQKLENYMGNETLSTLTSDQI